MFKLLSVNLSNLFYGCLLRFTRLKDPDPEGKRSQIRRRNRKQSRTKAQNQPLVGKKKRHKNRDKPKYMEKLNRKQCSAILRARASMLMVKANHKKTYEPNLLCRSCHKTPETQEHILQDCLKIEQKNGKVEYNKLFEDDVETLKGIAESIITIEEVIRNLNLNSMSSSDRSEPPGWPGHMQYYYYYYHYVR